MIYDDGILAFRTAALLEPYSRDFPDLGEEVGNKGINYFTTERMAK